MSEDIQAPLDRQVSRSVESGPAHEDEVEEATPGVVRRTGQHLRRVFRNRGALVGAIILTILVAVSVLVQFSSQDPTAIDMASHMLPPGGSHPFGTDQYGRDVLSRVLFGGQVTLTASLLGVAHRGGGGRRASVCSPDTRRVGRAAS